MLAALAAHLGAQAAGSEPATSAVSAALPHSGCRSLGNGHALCRVSRVVPRRGGAIVRKGRATPFDEIETPVLPGELKELEGWVETEEGTCAFVSSGSWVVTTPPLSGTTSQEIVEATITEGTCVGMEFPVSVIEYTWTNADLTQAHDRFAATWSTNDISDASDFTLDLGTIEANSVDLSTGKASLTIVGPQGDQGTAEFDFSGTAVAPAITTQASFASGTSTATIDRTKLKQGTYGDLVTKWNASDPAVYSDFKPATAWNVLGLVRYSQYNIPHESNCSGGTSNYYIVAMTRGKGGKTQCTFTSAALNDKFVGQTKINGTGASVSYGYVKFGVVTTMGTACPLPWPDGATLQNSFVQVESVTGACNKPLVAGVSAATSPKACGEKLQLVNSANINSYTRTAADKCPECRKPTPGAEGHIDSFTDTQFCDAHASNVDLGNYWTVRTN